ncbi:Ivy family c-type lysozyme inhibitor [Stenotrophomonas sp. SMYL20]|uniref:Ivy family c-type lysozyme inhibitor n=1 Tax=Stenotrophomonas sp. SMYL20 TaxID=3076043 RepID=UPI002E786C44|nr:Ivy family c-type lysozyme inhibitor [Stenotrophomonas sp. SMYL20]
MKIRITGMALTVALLAACGQAPAPDAAPTAPAPTTEAPAAKATVVEQAPSIEDGVDPSVWDNEGEPEDPSAGGELTCADNPLATHFFTLVGGNTVDDCGRKDPKVLAAFNALMKNTAAAESADKEIPSLRERLLSGPSGPGELMVLQGEPWWFYTACQAHDCPGTALAMLYSPDQSKMVGRLTARCRIWWLGEPSDEQRALIEREQPVDKAMLKEEGESCE